MDDAKFFIMCFCILLISCYYSYFSGNVKDSRTDIATEEFLWETRKVSKNMENKATMDFSFVNQSCSTTLKWENGYVALVIRSNGRTETFLGIGIEHCKGQTFSKWYEFKMEAFSYTHPKVVYIRITKDLICHEDMLTFFFRISTYPSPSYMIAENPQGYDAYYNDVAEEEKSTHKSNKGEKENRFSEVLNNLSQNLKDLYFEDQDQDVRIIVRSEILIAHRAILKARSPVLAAALKQETIEIREDNYDPKDFEIFLLFLYSGTVDNLNADNVISVYDIAEKYGVPDLMETCAGYMVSKLTIYSVIDVINVALKNKDYKLQLHATNFFLKHAEKIFPTTEWQTFLRQNPTTANELMIESYSYKNS